MYACTWEFKIKSLKPKWTEYKIFDLYLDFIVDSLVKPIF